MQGIAKIISDKKPWSRIVIASYMTSKEPTAVFGNWVASRRAEQIALSFVDFGIEARRVSTKGIMLESSVLDTDMDTKKRYSQAIEFILLD